MTGAGTLINVAAILAGTAGGVALGHRLAENLQQRVLAGLGLITLVLGLDLALAWRDTSALYVLGGILLGGLAGEWLRIEGRLEDLGFALQHRLAADGEPSKLAEGFVTASLLFCIGPLAVIGSFDDALRGDTTALATKAVLDGFAALALAAALGWGVALSALSVLVYQGALTLFAGRLDGVLEGEALAAMTSAGGILIVGIALKLLDVKDVRVGNFLPALLFAPLLVGAWSLVS